MTSVRSIKTLAAVLALILMLSLFSVSIFADEPAADDTTVVAEGEADAAPADDTAAPADDTSADADDTAAAADDTTAASDEDADDEDEHEHSFPWDAVVSFGIVIVAAIVLVIVYFANAKFKAKVQNFFRSLKSELGKVAWSSKNDVKKNTVIVLVFVLAFAVLIGLLDFLFSKGIIALGKLF